MDPYSMSDAELIRQLKKYNVAYGPIVDSTRRVYQKKLEKLMAAGPPSTIPLISSTADTLPLDDPDDYSDQEEDEYEIDPEPVVTRTRTVDKQELRQRTSGRYDQPDNVSYNTSYRTAPREEPDANYSRSSTTTRTTSSTTRMFASVDDTPVPSLSASDIVTQAEVPSETPKKGGLSIWIQLIIVLIVAFLIFLVFQNMEPAGKAPVRQLNHEDV